MHQETIHLQHISAPHYLLCIVLRPSLESHYLMSDLLSPHAPSIISYLSFCHTHTLHLVYFLHTLQLRFIDGERWLLIHSTGGHWKLWDFSNLTKRRVRKTPQVRHHKHSLQIEYFSYHGVNRCHVI